jgi:hypothetical protein
MSPQVEVQVASAKEYTVIGKQTKFLCMMRREEIRQVEETRARYWCFGKMNFVCTQEGGGTNDVNYPLLLMRRKA